MTRKRERHGHATGGGSITYHSWEAMIGRTSDPERRNYADRGITVCEEWKRFSGFLRDMGERPSRAHTIERINNDLGYFPGNCKWATRKEQMNNTRLTVFLTHEGVTLSLQEWAAKLKINPRTLHNRIKRGGWSVEDALRTGTFKGHREFLHANR